MAQTAGRAPAQEKESLEEMKIAVSLVVVLVLSLAAAGFADVGPSKVDPAAPANGSLVVTVSTDGTPVRDVLASLASQSKQKILVESSVKGNLKVGVKDTSLESALNTVCKATNLTWRKVYIDPKSDLLDKPDRFAATLRLIAGMSLPDLVVAGSSTNKVGVLCQQKQGVEGAQDKIVKDLGMEPVYLVSNDATVAARQGTSAAVNNYTKSAKEQLDMFMKMTPEEREQALMASLDMMDSVGPDYYASVMQTMMNTDPEKLQRLQKRGTDMLFSMSTEQRRSMMKINMQASSSFTPEQMKILQDDVAAIQAEMKKAQPTQ